MLTNKQKVDKLKQKAEELKGRSETGQVILLCNCLNGSVTHITEFKK